MWPADEAELERAQDALAAAAPPPWRPGAEPLIGACFVCFGRGVGGRGARGEPGWAAAALDGAGGAVAVVRGAAGAPYAAGRLALREGPLLAAAVNTLPRRPDVLLVDATGRDHPRRAGLALHLGAVLDLPTVGVTHRPLLARGDEPGPERGAHAPLTVEGDDRGAVGAWLRVVARRRRLAVHAAWRTDAETAIAVVLAATGRARTPEPLRRARRAARVARAGAGG
jgi:deoxyribonuclease V